ncbi:MAG TPA: FAD-dependent oxidoreductase [Vicinamibacteria bacterium]|nr:FAD-dependent oxidoreductase [Vicinamibacteria bacterium]
MLGPGQARVAKHVLIVGGGVVGLSTAYYAAAKGHRVTVVDEGPRDGDGCSFGNAGMVVPSHFVPLAAPGMVALGLRWMWNRRSPFHVRPRRSRELLGWGWRFWRAANAGHVARSAPLLRDLHLASRACFEELSTAWGDAFGLARNGLLMLCRTARGLEEEAHAAARARGLGLPAEVLTARGAAEREPRLRMDVVGGVFYPLDCHLDPGRFMAALTRALEGAGVELVWRTPVTGWRLCGGRVEAARTESGDLPADEFVLAAGAWSATLARPLGLRIPLQAGKGYSLTLPWPRPRPAVCAILSEARVAVTPLADALRFGGTLELGGLDRSIDPERIEGIVESVGRYYPELGPDLFRDVPAWSGLRPCSPDGLPYLGRLPRYANMSVATGHAMMGLSLGPISGKLMAEVLSGEPPSLDIAHLGPDRYHRGRT